MSRLFALALSVLLLAACGKDGECFDDRTCGTGKRCEILEPGKPGLCAPCDSAEIPYDGRDNDCDPDTRDWDLDRDGENPPHRGGADCDDNDPASSSRHAEVCGDDKDNDCDGKIDELDCGDREAPTIVFLAPAEDALIYGTFDIVAQLFDDVGIVRAQLFIDNIPVAAARDFTTPVMSQTVTFTVSSIDEAIPDGPAALRVELEDVAGKAGQGTRAVVLDNTTPPEIAWIAPIPGRTYGGLMTIDATVTDATGVQEVSFALNGATIGTSTGAPHRMVVDTSLFADGPATISIGAIDNLGNEVTEELVISIDNTPPELSFVRPIAGSTVSESVEVVIVASDATGVAQIWSEGLTATATTVLEYIFDTALVATGTHTLTATAADSALVDDGLGANVSTASVTIHVP